MRYLSMIQVAENTGRKPSERLMNEMGKLIEEMTREGTLVRTAGLRPTSEGVRVRLEDGEMSVVVRSTGRGSAATPREPGRHGP